MLCYVLLLCYVMLFYVKLSYAMLCYVMLCYVMVCYVIESCRAGVVPVVLLSSFLLPEDGKCSRMGSVFHVFPLRS